MKRITLTVVAILLAIPAIAVAKTGVGFKTDPQEVAPGDQQQFFVALFHEPPGPTGRAHPYGGHARPLVTFRSNSGRVIRVRALPLLSGESHGTVAFPDKGPWHTTINYRGRDIKVDEGDGGFSVGTAIQPLTPVAPAHAPSTGGGFNWWPLLLAIPLLGIAAGIIRRRRPHGGLGEIGAGGGA